MKSMVPSIFNDVIGPVMRGPSSSHCAAANRIGLLARDLMNGNIRSVKIQFDNNGSLATTHKSQGSDMGLFGGLLGMDCTDERLTSSDNHLQSAGIKVSIEIGNFEMTHPNTYRLILANEKESHLIEAISTGGGMIEVTEIDGFKLSIAGDSFETLLFTNTTADIVERLKKIGSPRPVLIEQDKHLCIRIRTYEKPGQSLINKLKEQFPEATIRQLAPVLPALSPENVTVPFSTCGRMMEFNLGRNLSLSELAQEYESERTGISKDDVFRKMQKIVEILQESIQTGLKGTDYADRILGCQSSAFKQNMQDGKLMDGGALNTIILYTSALMEMKSSMGIIVAAPTAGACAALPAACIGAADTLDLSQDDIVKGMLAAGLVGVFIATHSTFAAEVAGCQAECGSASGMAAAALVEMMGGTAGQAVAAASMALQNSLGMVCDPVANRVEVPCLGKNVMAASNAFSCANMALAGYDHVVPLDEVIQTMNSVGKSIDHKLRCTALGGLSITPTSQKIEDKLNNLNNGADHD